MLDESFQIILFYRESNIHGCGAKKLLQKDLRLVLVVVLMWGLNLAVIEISSEKILFYNLQLFLTPN